MQINMNELGVRCKEVRLKKKLRIADVAAATGYTIANISAFENGKIKSLPLFLYYRQLGLEISLKEVLINVEKN